MSLIGDLALVLGVAGATGLASRRLSLPPVLGYLAAGLVVGPYLPIPLFADPERVRTLSDLGVVLVMFAVGLEFRVRRFLEVLPTSGVAAAAQMGGMAWLGYGVAQLLGWTPVERLFLGGSLAISSTMVASKVLEEQHSPRDVRDLSLGILVLQDVVAIALLAALSVVASGGGVEPIALLRVVAEVLGLLILAVGVGMLLVPRLVRLAAETQSDETLLVTACGVCFVMAHAAEVMGYSVALGAFLAGVLVAESGDRQRVEHLAVPVRDLFAAVFFVSIGMSVDPRLVLGHLDLTLLFSLLVILGQLTALLVGGLLSGQGITRSVATGLALGQIGEFSFLLAGLGSSTGVLRPAFLPAILATAVVTTWTTPMLLRRSSQITGWIERRLPQRVRAIASLWTTWVGRARKGPEGQRTRLRQVALALVLDGVGLAIFGLGAYLWFPGKVSGEGQWILSLVASAATIPLAVGLVRNTGDLGTCLGELVFPEEASGASDPDDPSTVLEDRATRSLARALAPLLVIVGLGLPLAALLRPFLPAPVLVPFLLLGGIPAVFQAWRRSGRVEQEVSSGLEQVLERLSSEAREDRHAPTPAQPLPGLQLGDMVTLEIPPESGAIGRSLRDLGLRVRTGATVLAVRRDGLLVPVPEGTWVLASGDTVVLAGSESSRGRARLILEGPPGETIP